MMTAAIVIIVYTVYRVLQRSSGKRAASNVIKLSKHRGHKRARNEQKCSICHKRSARLRFYADEQGKPIGVCDKCKPIAERRALLRL